MNPTFTPIDLARTNVKLGSGRPESLELGSRVTVLWGPHGSGKTRWVQALAWLLTGTMDDTGRNGNESSASWEIDLHRPADAKSTWAEVYQGTTVLRAELPLNAKTGRPTSKPTLTGLTHHPMAFPVREVASWLRKSPEEAWAKFLPHIAYGLRGETIAAQIGEGVVVEVESASGMTIALPTTLTDLIALRERAAASEATATSDAKRVRELATAARANLGTIATSAEIEKLAATVQSARQRIAEADEAAGIPALQAELAGLRDLVTRGEAAVATQYPDPGPRPAGVAFIDLIDRGATLRADALAAGMSVCPVSGVRWADAKLNGLSAVATKLRTANQDWITKHDVHTRAMAKLNGFREQVARLEALLAKRQAEKAVLPEVLQEWRTKLAAAETRLQTLRASRDAYERVQQYEEQVRQYERLAKVWGDLHTATSQAVKALMDLNLEAFIARIQEAIPDRYIVRIDTSIDGRAVFRPWLEDKLDAGRAMSGGQRGMMLLALTRIVVLTSHNLPGCSLLALPEERSIDGATLGDLCRLWGRLDGPQLLLTSTEAPQGDLPVTVKVYALGGAEASPSVAPTRQPRKRKAPAESTTPQAGTTMEPAEVATTEPAVVAVEPAAAPAAAKPAPKPSDDPFETLEVLAEVTVAKDEDESEVAEPQWDDVGQEREPDATRGALPAPDDAGMDDPFSEPKTLAAEAAKLDLGPVTPAEPPKPAPLAQEASDIDALRTLLAGELKALFSTS